MKGASGRYDGAIVKVVGTMNGDCEFAFTGGLQFPVKAVHGNTVVASTMPGRMLPTTEPMPGKFEAVPKLPLPPNGVPIRLTNGGAIALPVKPKFGPVPPMNGNCTNGCPPTLQGGPAGRNSGLKPVRPVEPLTRSGGSIAAAPLHNSVAPKNSC